ncbi:MAG: hypothetical protein ABIP91_05130 [Sphingomicrobium sp.]
MSEQNDRDGPNGLGDDIRQRAIDTYDGARANVSDAGRKASDALGEAPLLALAGGLVAGALIAALLPRSEGETKLLRPAGKRLAGTAKAAADAAREAGTARLSELGLTREAGAETLRSVLKGAGEAARTSAEAAMTKVRGSE